MAILIETERLILREFGTMDEAGIFELDSDPEVHRFLGNHPIKTREEARDDIAFVQRQYRENGIGRWAVIDKNSGEFLGWSGLKFVTETINGHVNYYDLGYRLIRRHWGKGYATEAAVACRDYAFNELRLDELFAYAHMDNAASNHILQKTGFIHQQTFELEGTVLNWYRLTMSNAR